MAMTYATVTGKLVIPGTTTGVPGTITATPLVDGKVLTFPAENLTTLGGAVAQVAADGTLTPELQIPTDVPDGTYWRLTFTPKERGIPTHLGDYEIPASADLADLVQVITQAITPALALDIQAAEGYAAAAAAHLAAVQQVVIADLGTTDGQTKTLIETDGTLTKTALSATIATSSVEKSGEILGGQVPKLIRAPILVVEDSWPNRDHDYRIVWAENDGATLYGYAYDGSLYKSTDHGKAWTRRGYWGIPLNRQGAFLKTPTGALLAFADGSAAPPYRSADDGATWTVATGTYTSSSAHPLGSQSWAIDANTGYIYYGEYTTDATKAVINLYRSTNDGATWSVFYAFPGPTSGHANKIRHIHSVQWDHVAGRIVIMTGDSEPAAGMYRVNAAGTGVEEMVLNRDIPAHPDGARAIGIMPFPDYIAWVPDTSAAYAFMLRAPRTDLTDVEITSVRLNYAGWFTVRASADGSRWVAVTGQDENTGIDGLTHLYAVENQGATVYDLGGIATPLGAALGESALAPVGTPEGHGDVFFMQAHNVATASSLALTSPSQESGRNAAWKFRLGDGSGSIPWPEHRRNFYGRKCLNSGRVAIAGGFASTVVGRLRVPQNMTKLYIFDAGVDCDEDAVRGAVRLAVGVRGAGGTIWDTTRRGEAAFLTAEAGEQPVAVVACTPAADLEVRMFSAGAAYNGTGYLDYAFGI